MNKYQEALDRLNELNEKDLKYLKDKYGIDSDKENKVMTQLNLSVLQELVDKEISIKPVDKEIENLSVFNYIPFIVGVCPKCEYESINEIHTYCSNCGQKLDWTDSDE